MRYLLVLVGLGSIALMVLAIDRLPHKVCEDRPLQEILKDGYKDVNELTVSMCHVEPSPYSLRHKP